VLATLDGIENRDALLNPDGTEADWPEADVIIGNPPFLGGKKLRTGLGDAAVEQLFKAYKGRVPAEADLVCYWVERAWRAVGEAGAGRRAGLVTTNSIRGGASRKVLEPIAAAGALREAWADEPWVLEGAAVRVSMVGFGQRFAGYRLDGAEVARINADLTNADVNITAAKRLSVNRDIAFQGPVLIGNFQVSGDDARLWLKAPTNPNGRHNADVLQPILNASDIARRSSDRWVINFRSLSESQAALFEQPFRHVLTFVRPERVNNRRTWRAEQWWKHGESGGGWGTAISDYGRYIITPRVSKHRIFIFVASEVFPD